MPKKIPHVKVRPWAHRIWWAANNGDFLPVLHADGHKLEKLIEKHGELCVAVAWKLFVDSDECHRKPLEIAVKQTDKRGKEYIGMAEDDSVVVRFPLAAFLAVADGPIPRAEDMINGPEWKAGNRIHDAVLAAMAPAQQRTSG